MFHRMLFAAALLLMPLAAHAETFTLNAAPNTVAWGNYDATTPPVLRIHSGDTVVFRTLLTNSPTGLEKAGVKPADVEQALRDVFANVPQANRGPAGTFSTVRSSSKARNRATRWKSISRKSI
jgi:hypothetical protein